MHKYISCLTEIIKGHLTGKNIPIFATVCLTNRCNLRCRYCYGASYDRNHREFTTQELVDLIDTLADMGTKYISLNGGEALLRDDLETIVDKINEKKILSHLSTNGLLIKDKITLMKKIGSIAISIDGLRESNDANRGVGTYDRIIEAIEWLHKNKIKFHTQTVLTKNNKNAIDEILNLACKYNFRSQIVTLRKEDSPDKSIALDTKELKEFVGKIITRKKEGFPVFFSTRTYQNLLNWPFSYEKEMIYEGMPKNYKAITCYLKRFFCHIEANGLVYPCIVLVNKFKALNFLEVGFKNAWENLANNECKACYNVCCNDMNLIFELKPYSFWNLFKILIDRTK